MRRFVIGLLLLAALLSVPLILLQPQTQPTVPQTFSLDTAKLNVNSPREAVLSVSEGEVAGWIMAHLPESLRPRTEGVYVRLNKGEVKLDLFIRIWGVRSAISFRSQLSYQESTLFLSQIGASIGRIPVPLQLISRFISLPMNTERSEILYTHPSFQYVHAVDSREGQLLITFDPLSLLTGQFLFEPHPEKR